MARYYRIRNWDKFQHYKDRSPPWIKLHVELLDNYEFSRLQDASKLLAICTMLIAARSDNRIPADSEWVRQRCNLKHKPDFSALLETGFLEEIQEVQQPERNASNTLAEDKHAAIKMLLRGEERRGETESASAPVEGLDFDAWTRWVEYRKGIGKPLKSPSIPAAQRKLAALGPQQLAAVENSIAEGYQGIFPPKVNGHSKPKIVPGAAPYLPDGKLNPEVWG